MTAQRGAGAVAGFDPAGAVTFDLARGLVERQGEAPALVVPAAALGALAKAAGAEAAARFGRDIGLAVGRRVATRLGGAGDLGVAAVREASLDVVVTEIGGELALSGLGALSLERWGRALVVRVDGSPLGAEGDALLEAVLAAALGSAAGRELSVVRLERDAGRARFLVGSAAAEARVRAWLDGGVAWADALARLHAAAGAAGSHGS